MVKSLRTRNRFSASTVDQVPHQLVASLLFGHQLLIPIPDIDRTSYFLVFGANPMASNGSLMTVPDFPQRLRDLQARGGRMVVVDPRRTETARVADEHVFVRPGTDAAVLLAMVHVLFEEGLTRPASYVDGVERVRDAVADFSPEHAERVSGVPAETVRRLTRELAAADGGVAYGRLGLSTQGFGTVCQWAVACLNVLTGNLDREGGALFTEPAIDFVTTRLIGRGHHDLYRSRVRGAPEYGGELPVSVFAEEIETPGEGQVRAALTIAGNPVLSTPDGKRLGAALRVARLHGGGRHLRQRDDPARRRDPAAHHDPRAGPLRHRVPRAGGPEHRAVHRGRGRQAARRPPRLGDLPRPDPPDHRAAGPEAAAAHPAPAADAAGAEPDVRHRDAAAPRTPYDDHRPAAHPAGRRPRPAAARRCPAGCRRRTSGSTSPSRWCSTTSTGSGAT